MRCTLLDTVRQMNRRALCLNLTLKYFQLYHFYTSLISLIFNVRNNQISQCYIVKIQWLIRTAVDKRPFS